MSSKALGQQWIVNEHKAKLGEVSFNAIQTLRYDAESKTYSGNWIDSMSDFKWTYNGTLSDDRKSITLNAKGPDWNDPSKMADYRDIYEFKNENLIVTRSQIQQDGKWNTFMEGTLTRVNPQPKVMPFLMFQGKGLDALALYESIFDDFETVSMKKHGPNGQGKEGTIEVAVISIAGQKVKVIDSPPVHEFTFTPSFSFFVECKSEDELDKKYKALSEGGKTMMPPNNYGFSKKFCWVSDKFGVSWQLNVK